MILFLTFLLFQILVTNIGVGILRVISFIKRDDIESLAIGYLIGAVAFSFYIFLILIAGGSLSSLSVGMFFIVGTGGTVYLIGKRGAKNYLSQECFLPFKISDGWKKTSTIQKGLISLMGVFICFKLFLGLWFIFNAPAYFDDAITHWNIRAKNIYFEKFLNFNPENKEMSFLGGSIFHYPFFLVTYKAGLSLFIGQWHEGYANIFHFITFIILIMIFFLKSYEYSEGNIFITTVFTFMAASAPLAFFHSFTAHGDMITGIFFVLSLIYLVDYIRKNEMKELILSGIFLFGATFTKNEGLVLIFSSISLTAIIFAFLWKDWRLLIPSTIAFALLLPHNLMRLFYNLRLNPIADDSIGYHKHTVKIFSIVMTEWGHSNILWYIVPAILILFLRYAIQKKEIKFTFVALFLVGVLIFFTFGFTASFTDNFKNQMAVNRTLMMYSFSLVYFLMMLTNTKRIKK